MNTTSFSLLERLQRGGQGTPDWQRLQDIYRPLIRSWLAHVPGIRDEIEDLTQEVFVVLLRELPSFERRRDGAFRAWLRQVTVNRIRAFHKSRRKQPLVGLGLEGENLLDQLQDPGSELAQRWDREHDRHVSQKLLAIVQPDFEPVTWLAFTRFALDGLPVDRVAEELEISSSAVVQAKFRVLKRLRQEAGALME